MNSDSCRTEPSSSSPTMACQGPSDEVTELALEAQSIQTLNPVVAVMLKDPDKKRDFLHHMYRQITIIKSRSQAFEDAHVTVYDKTLLTLTHNGNHLDHPPAIAYYCDEFLGIGNITDPVYAHRMFEESVGVPKLLTQGYSPPSSHPRSSVECFEVLPNTERRQSNPAFISSDKSSDKSCTLRMETPDMEPQIARLWNLYENARADFRAVLPKKDPQATANSARFLRDTAENTIQYLKTKDFDPVMMAEIHAVSDLAKAAAVSATGGKKRKFDAPGTDEVKEDSRGFDRTRGNSQRRDRYTPYSGFHRVSEDRYNTRRPMEARRANGPGRGHSGIPYGYSRFRAVDSYHPY